MTRQTEAPLPRYSTTTSARSAREIARLFTDGYGDLSPSYQRDSVWTEDQRIALVRSWVMELPVPAVVINDRVFGPWPKDSGRIPEGGFEYSVIDGKQRIETAIAWFAGEIAVPASWFDADAIEAGSTEDTEDGPYVRYTGLTLATQRGQGVSFQLPTVEARVESLEAEAEMFLVLNGGGTPQTDSDMANAAAVANS